MPITVPTCICAVSNTQQNSYSISHLLLRNTVTTQLLESDSVVTVLPAVVNSDYTVTVQSLCSHCAQ